MKRELLFFLLLFVFLGSIIHAYEPDVISPNIPPTKNQTHLEIQYFPQGNNQFRFNLNLYQIVTKKESYDDVYEMLTPQEFFNREYVEDGLTLLLKYNGNVIGSCETKNSKCEIDIDLKASIFPEDKNCFEIYGEFEETDTLREYQTSDILICRDKNIMVGEAFKEALSFLDTDEESQHVCILFFVFIGFLISALFASGGNPLRYFDITTPRLPKAKSKIKIDINTKENEIKRGRRDVSQIKKNLVKTQRALFKALEETALKVLKTKYEKIGKKRGWNESKIYATYIGALRKYMREVKKEFEKLSKGFEKDIDSQLKDKKGIEAVTLEADLRKEKTDKLIGFMESKLKLEDFADEFKEKELDEFRQKQLEEYRTSYLNFHSAEMAVDLRSNLMRGAPDGKRIGRVRKLVESIPVVSDISLSAEALFRKRGSLEIKTAEYTGIKLYETFKHHSGKKRAEKMFREIENDGFYNQLSIVPENERYIDKIRREGKLKELELIKDDLDKLKEGLEDVVESKDYEEHKNELLANVVKEKLSESDKKLSSIKNDFIDELTELSDSEDVSEEKKKYIKKLIKVYSAKKINLKKLDADFEDNIKEVLTDIEIEKGEEAVKEKTNKLIDSHKLFVEEIALNEELKDDDKKLSLFQTSSAILKPDTMMNNITALYYSKNFLRELENIPCKYIVKNIKKSIKEKNKKDKEKLKESLNEFSLDYGKLVRDYNPKERYPHLVELAKKYKLEEEVILKSDSIFNDVSKFKVESSSQGFIKGADEIINYFDNFKENEDFLELGIFDTMQDPREIFASYLEVYSAYDSKIGEEQEKISKVLTEKGFEKAIDIVEGMSFSEKEIDRLFPKTYHDVRSQQRLKKELKDYLPYVVFSGEFDDSLNLFKENMKRRHNQEIEFDDERVEKVRDYYAEFMSENYKDNSVGLSSNMFEKNKSELSENEIKFIERAEVVFKVASNSLVPDSEYKEELIDFFKLNLDLSEKNMKNQIKEIDIDNNKYVFEKWKKDSSRHRAEAIRMPVLQQNIFKLRDYVETSVSTYDKLYNIGAELNNEKKDKILMMNLYLGGIVKNPSELSGQQIFNELSSNVVGVLGSSYDKYFRKIYEEPRMEILKEAFTENSAIKIAREEFFQKNSLDLIKKELSKTGFFKLEALNYLKKELGEKVTKENARDILENNFDDVRESLSLSPEFDDSKMKEIKNKII